MIGYVTLGTKCIDTAAGYYDQLLSLIGAKRSMDMDGFILWASTAGKASLAITRPYDKQEASVGNGVMVAIYVDSQEQVDEFHQKAIELGGSNEGEPGLRGGTFYAGYFRDLDGNKLNVFTM